jgi:hypothetical protein
LNPPIKVIINNYYILVYPVFSDSWGECRERKDACEFLDMSVFHGYIVPFSSAAWRRNKEKLAAIDTSKCNRSEWFLQYKSLPWRKSPAPLIRM